jgi:hypothetical protein
MGMPPHVTTKAEREKKSKHHKRAKVDIYPILGPHR